MYTHAKHTRTRTHIQASTHTHAHTCSPHVVPKEFLTLKYSKGVPTTVPYPTAKAQWFTLQQADSNNSQAGPQDDTSQRWGKWVKGTSLLHHIKARWAEHTSSVV